MISKTNRLAMLGVLASLIAISHADGECGARNQAPCNGEQSCEEGLVEYTYTNSDSETVTVCSPCGHWNRLPCTVEGTEPCAAGLAIDTEGKVTTAGTCIGCGTNKRPVCTHDGEEPCENGYYEKDGYCYTCGIEGAAFCEGQNKCLPGYTPMLDNTEEACTRCGYKDMPACANPNESPCSNGLGVNHDSGLCEYCGTAGKPGCETTCEPCRTGLALDGDGLCQYCGWSKRVWCTNQGEDICRNGLTPAEDGTCQACGSNGKPQCGIMGTHLAEVWEFNGESGESFDITGTAFSFKAVTDDQYRVTKEPRGNNYLGGAASMEYLLRNITEPETFDLDFEFPFYGTKYSSLCLSSQGHIVFPDTEGLFTGCELIDTETPITLETHYNAKRISFSFDHWTPSCGDKGLGCMHARKGVLEDGRKFFMVSMLNVADVSNPAYDLNVAQVQTRIMSDGEIQMYTRWSRSRDGLMGISPGYAPLNYEEVNFSGEFCNPRTTPLADGTCATCGGKNQPICENSKSDEPCRNNYVEETDEDGKKTGLCVRA